MGMGRRWRRGEELWVGKKGIGEGPINDESSICASSVLRLH